MLLLEIGRERRKQGLPFILALEEPELHVPPGLQRKLVAQAVAIAEQTICTSHAPRVAAFYPATSTLVVDRAGGELSAVPMLETSLAPTATSVQRKLYLDDRSRIVDALMHHRVLVPEGRGPPAHPLHVAPADESEMLRANASVLVLRQPEFAAGLLYLVVR